MSHVPAKRPEISGRQKTESICCPFILRQHSNIHSFISCLLLPPSLAGQSPMVKNRTGTREEQAHLYFLSQQIEGPWIKENIPSDLFSAWPTMDNGNARAAEGAGLCLSGPRRAAVWDGRVSERPKAVKAGWECGSGTVLLLCV